MFLIFKSRKNRQPDFPDFHEILTFLLLCPGLLEYLFTCINFLIYKECMKNKVVSTIYFVALLNI